ncbi:MAG: energy-coupling factor ABC transporter permease [Candidatus Bathyarchaeia archaeon]|nr:energy-coupling factor ABC transporter permease [Candidatus Bathyarchaeota archaeon]
MHIPDGFLDLKICSVTYVLTAVFWFFAFRKAKKVLTDKQIPLMAVLTAMFFAAQMMNYPIIGGTTAHLLGGPILAITLGPYGGLISMTIILLIQALFFGDGGITTFGANVWNMGVIGVFVPYIIWALFPKNKKGMILGAFIGAFIGDVLAAISAGLELGLSAKFLYGVSIAVPAMALHHSIMGVGEGIVTSIIIVILLKSRPDLLDLPKIAPNWLSK